MAEVDKDVDAGPVEESVLGVLVTAVDKSAKKTQSKYAIYRYWFLHLSSR